MRVFVFALFLSSSEMALELGVGGGGAEARRRGGGRPCLFLLLSFLASVSANDDDDDAKIKTVFCINGCRYFGVVMGEQL